MWHARKFVEAIVVGSYDNDLSVYTGFGLREELGKPNEMG
jgi:hypothetical protein